MSLNDPQRSIKQNSSAAQDDVRLSDLRHPASPVVSPLLSQLTTQLLALSSKSLISTLTQAIALLQSQRTEGVLTLPSSSLTSPHELHPLPAERNGGHVYIRSFPNRSLVVFGDTHGDLASLLTVLSRSQFTARAERGEDIFLIGLGDYVNKGNHSLENVFTLAFLLTSPVLRGRVIPLAGNHESNVCSAKGERGKLQARFLSSLRNHRILSLAPESEIREAQFLFASFFDELPLSLETSNGIFASHAGYSHRIKKCSPKDATVQLTQWPPSRHVTEELLQSIVTTQQEDRPDSMPFAVTRCEMFDFMQRRGAHLLLRGHQPIPPEATRKNSEWRQGYWWLTQSQGENTRRVLTLNSYASAAIAMPAFAEISLSSLSIGYRDCSIFTH